MKKLLIIITLLAMCGCGNLRKVSKEDNNLGASMKATLEMVATMRQVDSICVADTLPKIEKWTKANFRDFETGKQNIRMIYVKNPDTKPITYVIYGINEPFKVIKRETK